MTLCKCEIMKICKYGNVEDGENQSRNSIIPESHNSTLPQSNNSARSTCSAWLKSILSILLILSKASALPAASREIQYTLPDSANVTVVIENAQGRRVRNLVADAPREEGKNVETWDGYDDAGNPCAAGEYRWRGLTHGKIESRYAGSFYSPGDPPWRTMSQSHRYNINFTGAGGWLSDHYPPLCVAASGGDVFVGAQMAEAGCAIIRVDAATGRKIWGTSMVALTGASAFARDGDTLFIAGEGGWSKNKLSVIRLDLNTYGFVPNPDDVAKKRGGANIHQQRSSAFAVEKQSDFSDIRGMALTPSEIVLSLADKGGRIVFFSRETAEFTREIALPGAGQLATAPDGSIWAAFATGVANVKLWNCENMELCKAVAGNSASLGSRSARLGRVPTGCGHPQGAVTRLCVKISRSSSAAVPSSGRCSTSLPWMASWRMLFFSSCGVIP